MLRERMRVDNRQLKKQRTRNENICRNENGQTRKRKNGNRTEIN